MSLRPRDARRIRVTYIVQHHHRRRHLESVVNAIDRSRFELTFILLGETAPAWISALEAASTPYYYLKYAGPDHMPAMISEVCDLCRRLCPDVVHIHYGETLAGLLGAYFAGVPVRVYTRHHARLPVGRALPPREQTAGCVSAAAATHIVAPGLLVRDVLLEEGVASHKISVINFGLDAKVYQHVPLWKVEAARKRYLPAGANPVVGMVSRAVELKGIQYVIPAFRKILETYPNAILLLVNPAGPYRDEIERMLASKIPGHFAITGHDDEIEALYKLFDVLVHAPVGPHAEAFGLVYIEAMAAGAPLVATKSGIALEVVDHARNAWVVDYGHSDQIARGVITLLADRAARGRIIAGGMASASAFTVERMVSEHEGLYSRLAHETLRS
jgi:glycosyltransferase involved in cell wall biosynthesis